MENAKGMPASLCSSTSDTDSLNASPAAASPAISPVDSSFLSPPSSAYAESKIDVGCTHIYGTDTSPEDGRCSVSSNLDEETVRQHTCDITAEAGCELQAWDASPIHQSDNLEQALQVADANLGCGSDDANANQMAIDMYADTEKEQVFANVKQVNGGEEGQGECCRVCHLSAMKSHRASEFMKLGCACKDDLALAHRHCAETWFKIKGNRTCEICGSTAQNIQGNGGANFDNQSNDMEANSLAPRRAERCWQNQPICNTVLVCVILVFLASWLFRVAIF